MEKVKTPEDSAAGTDHHPKPDKFTNEELLELKHSLDKKKEHQDYGGIMSILKLLQKKQISLELLQHTKIGKTISSLSKIEAKTDDAKNDVSEVRKTADHIIEIWKKVSKQEKNQEKKEQAKKHEEKKVASSTKSEGSQNGGIYIPPSIKIATGIPIRDSMIRKFIEILQQNVDGEPEYDTNTKELAAQLAVGIEECMDNKFPDPKSYSDKARSLIFNLKDPKNPMLRTNIIQGLITPWDLVTLDSKELASDSKRLQRAETQKANLQARRTDWALENAASKGNKGFFTCKKCHSKNTTYFQMQTRGADEPMTNFVTCLDCKHQWKC